MKKDTKGKKSISVRKQLVNKRKKCREEAFNRPGREKEDKYGIFGGGVG
jgi:hypothetical protein